MTRKDYKAIADTLLMSKPPTQDSAGMFTWIHIVHALADTLADDNPRFNRARFLAACGAPLS